MIRSSLFTFLSGYVFPVMAMLVATPQWLAGSGTAGSLKEELRHHPEDTHKVWILRDIAFEYQFVDSDSAVHYSSKGLELATRLDFLQGRIWNLYQLALAYEISHRLDSAFAIYEQALDLASRYRDNLSRAKLYNSLGVAHYYAGNFSMAVDYYTKGYALSDTLRYNEGKTYALNNLGVIYRLQRQYEKALEVYRKSLDMKYREQDTVGVVNSLYNIGLAYSFLQQYRESLNNLLAARDLSELVSHEGVDIANLDLGLGVAYFNLSMPQEARHYLESGLGKERITGSPEWISAMTYLGALDVQQGNIEEGREKIEQAYIHTKNTGRLELLARVMRERAMASGAAGMYQQATGSWYQYAMIADSLNSEHRRMALEEMQAKFELQDKQITIAFQELQLLREGRRIRFILISGLMLIILLSASAVFLYLFWKQGQQLKSEVKEKQKALAENQMLLREMHHRTKNNLQLLDSMLSIQMRSENGAEARHALKNTRDNISAITLLHHQLYKSGDIRKIPLREFIIDLVNYFNDAFALKKQNIEVVCRCSHVQVDMDTAIPLGLTINELMTNAIKHAFPGDDGGIIELNIDKQDNQLLIEVKDNGTGLHNSAETSGSGTSFLKILGVKLRSHLEYLPSAEGTVARITIPFEEELS